MLNVCVSVRLLHGLPFHIHLQKQTVLQGTENQEPMTKVSGVGTDAGGVGREVAVWAATFRQERYKVNLRDCDAKLEDDRYMTGSTAPMPQEPPKCARTARSSLDAPFTQPFSFSTSLARSSESGWVTVCVRSGRGAEPRYSLRDWVTLHVRPDRTAKPPCSPCDWSRAM